MGAVTGGSVKAALSVFARRWWAGEAGVEYRKAIRHLDRMLEMQPTRPIHYYNRGDSYRRLAMDAAAKRDFKKFLGNTALPPENPKVKSAFAFTYRK